MIQRNVQLEVQLIDDLLDLTRVTKGKLEIAPVCLDLHELLRHTLQVDCDLPEAVVLFLYTLLIFF